MCSVQKRATAYAVGMTTHRKDYNKLHDTNLIRKLFTKQHQMRDFDQPEEIYSAATLSLFPSLPESGKESRSVRTSFTS